jgi:formate hydrogenlyase subunit 3/multisubunit Na+/H+ antiporter MnhD subunit
MSIALPIALLAPWFALLLLPLRRALPLLLVAAPLPLVLLAVTGEGSVETSRMLLGASFAVDATNRPLLLLAGVGWAVAGAFAATSIESARGRFGLFWLLTLAGQALAFLAADIASFYTGYALMTLAAWGLVVHSGSDEAWRAGRVYLVLSLAGEMLVLSGLLLIAAGVGNADFQTLSLLPIGSLGAAPWLLFAGFAVKLGIVPLHVWLPLAHPVAPVAASAVLSGLLVKAGLLGMLRVLPADSLPGGPWLLSLGLFTAVYGVVAGLGQSRLKTVLAYSTISQMGLALAGFAALQASLGSPLALAALGLFALHHGLNKIALFLAAGHLLRGWLPNVLFLLPALAIAGLPMTAGALAKDALKQSFGAAGLDAWLLALGLSSALTTALLLHAWLIARRAEGGRDRVHPAWALAVLAGLALPWLWAPSPPTAAALWSGSWPLLLGVLLYLGLRRRLPRWPEGDIVVPLEAAVAGLLHRLQHASVYWREWRPTAPAWQPWVAPAARIERALARLPMTGAGLLLVVLATWWLLQRASG